jgi:hypothetical protein
MKAQGNDQHKLKGIFTMQAYNYVATCIAVGNDSFNRLETASLKRSALKLCTDTHVS